MPLFSDSLAAVGGSLSDSGLIHSPEILNRWPCAHDIRILSAYVPTPVAGPDVTATRAVLSSRLNEGLIGARRAFWGARCPAFSTVFLA